MDGLGPHFLLANSLERWYLDFLKMFTETELGVGSKYNAQKLHMRIDF